MKPIRVFNRTLHKEMWNWLADNPAKDKSDWIEIHKDKLTKEQRNTLYDYHRCFACHCAKHSIYDKEDCKKCPLDWGPNRSCCKYNNLYTAWSELYDSFANTSAISAIAEAIANLPIKEYNDAITIVI